MSKIDNKVILEVRSPPRSVLLQAFCMTILSVWNVLLLHECPPHSSPPPQVCPNATPRRPMVTTVVAAHHPHTFSILLSCCPFLRALSVFLATHSSCILLSDQLPVSLSNSLTHNKHLEQSLSHNSILGVGGGVGAHQQHNQKENDSERRSVCYQPVLIT